MWEENLPMLSKGKLSSDIGSVTIKANIELSGKEIEKYPRNVFTIITFWMVIHELMTGILFFSNNVRLICN